jgi:hypothetical protein
VWGQARVYRDCHLTFQRAYYAAPFRLVGQDVWVRAGARTVELYTAAHELVATHDRATSPGQRQTLLAHLPPEKVPGLVLTREDCRAQAQAIGPATTTLVERLLDHRPEDRLRVAGRLVRLATQYPPARLEQACVRALAYGTEGTGDYVSVKRILQADLDGAPLDARDTGATRDTGAVTDRDRGTLAGAAAAPAAAPARRFTFVRQAGEFVASLFGTTSLTTEAQR